MGNKSSSPEVGESERFHVDLVDPSLPFTNTVDAVVCFIDEKWSDGDELNKTLLELGGNRYESHRSHLRDKNPSCKIGEVHIGRGEKLPSQVVLFCAVPSLGKEGYHGEDYGQQCAMAIDNIFHVAFSCTQEIEIRSIAFPMETGPPSPDPSVLLPLLFYKYSQLPADSVLKHIHVFTTNEGICQLLSKTVHDFKVELEHEQTVEAEERNSCENVAEVPVNQTLTSNDEYSQSEITLSETSASSPEDGRLDQSPGIIGDSEPMDSPLQNDHQEADSVNPQCEEVNSGSENHTEESHLEKFDNDLSSPSVHQENDLIRVVESNSSISLESVDSSKNAVEDFTEASDGMFQNDLGLRPVTEEPQQMSEDLEESENQGPNATLPTQTGRLDEPPEVEDDRGSYQNDLRIGTPQQRDISGAYSSQHNQPLPDSDSLAQEGNISAIHSDINPRNEHTNSYSDDSLDEDDSEDDYEVEEDDEIPWKKKVGKHGGDQLWKTFSEGTGSISKQRTKAKDKKKSSNKFVTFSQINEVQEIDNPHSTQLVRSTSNSSAEEEPLDFENIIVQKSQRPTFGRKPMKGLPTIEVKYDPEVIEQKESKTYFCVICQSEKDIEHKKKLDKCEHIFCKECIDAVFKQKPVCPVCKQCYGVVVGNMPYGLMSYRIVEQSLPGHEGYGIILVEYDIPDGIQTEEHPNPGQPFKGVSRMALLPGTPQGHRAFKLLQKAFDRRLTFTVGTSRTSGRENVVTWNDIHHKTNIQGGPQRFGYPDPNYLDRLEAELAALGITEDDPTVNEEDLQQ